MSLNSTQELILLTTLKDSLRYSDKYDGADFTFDLKVRTDIYNQIIEQQATILADPTPNRA